MGESLYAILGVAEDADREAIRDAYRNRAKRHHPDVSDATDATRRFKRLTVARDTLVDERERARYDELGHDRYVSQHVSSDLFDVTTGPANEPTASPSETVTGAVSEAAARTVADGAGAADQWWRQRAGPEPKPTAGRSEQARTGGTAASWAQSRSSTRSPDRSASSSRMVRVVREAGAWLVLHFLLFCSAVATAAFLYTSVGPALAAPALVAGLLIVLIAVAASTFHLVSIVYT